MPLTLVGGTTGAIDFGLRTQIWPFMWANGREIKDVSGLNNHQKLQWNVAEKNLGIYKAMGAKWNIVIVRHKLDASVDWARLEKIIKKHKQAGLFVMFRLIEDPRVYDNLASDSDPGWGYNQKYYAWVHSLAMRFQADVKYYMIGNEVDHDLGHNLPKYKKTIVDYSQYAKLVRTARKAIKGVSPDLKVVDCGVSSFTLGLAVASKLKKEDNVFSAYQFWDKFKYDRLSAFGGLPWLVKMLGRENIKRRIRFAKDTYSDCKVFDAIQLHHYFSPDSLPQIMDWIKSNLSAAGCHPEIIATEIGYRVPFKKGKTWDGRSRNVADWEKYEPDEHAASLVKDFTILLENNVKHLLYWQARFHNDRSPTATLFHSDGDVNNFEVWPAGLAYKVFVKKIGNKAYKKEAILNKRELHEASFSSDVRLVIVWAEDEPVLLNGKDLLGVDAVFGMYGNKIEFSGKRQIKIGNKPVYLEWPVKPSVAN